MVGSEGDRPADVGGKALVIAKNEDYSFVTRTVLLDARKDGRSWQVGDEIGLLDGQWGEVTDNTHVRATVREIIG